MSKTTRRVMLGQLAFASTALMAYGQAPSAPRKWTLNLMPGMIGVTGGQREIIDLAAKHGFESVEPQADFLARLSEMENEQLLGEMRAKKVVFGAAGLGINFRQDEIRFSEGLKLLPKQAEGLKRAGVTRIGTWLTPGHNNLTYLANLRQHAQRLREVANILKGNGIRLGIEYVGTITSRNRFKYGFVRTLAETKDLIAEIGLDNAGLILDSWHWWQAGDTAADILALKPEQIIAVDLNDAPAGIDKDKQLDGQRELPLATGGIDLKPFLEAITRLGYDGPVRAEPFNKALNALDNDQACARTSEALKKAAGLF